MRRFYQREEPLGVTIVDGAHHDKLDQAVMRHSLWIDLVAPAPALTGIVPPAVLEHAVPFSPLLCQWKALGSETRSQAAKSIKWRCWQEVSPVENAWLHKKLKESEK